MRPYRMHTLRLRMCWAASDLEPIELNPLHIGSEYLAELGQIPLDPAPWSEQLDVRLVVVSAETVGPADVALRFPITVGVSN
jgi:hypothetical protein